MTSDQVAAVGAFLSGMGSIVGATWFVRRQKRNAREECDQRIAELGRALREGIEIERQAHEDS